MLCLIAISFLVSPFAWQWNSRRLVLANQSSLLREASKMSDQLLTSDDHAIYLVGDLIPDVFQSVGASAVSVSKNEVGVLTLAITSGFSHTGFLLVPDCSNSSIASVLKYETNRGVSIKPINCHLYEYWY